MKNYLSSLLAVGLVISAIYLASAAQPREARVTEKRNDVRVLAPNVESRPAALNENIREGSAVHTGTDSRAELTFVDQTIARLGANTVFGIGTQSRAFDLDHGAILLYAPKSSGAVKVDTVAVTAGITGFTAMFEFHPNAPSKFIILEGNGTLAIKGSPGGPCHLRAGQMVVIPPHPTSCPDVYNIDLQRLVKTSKLITQFPPLPSLDLIRQEITTQQTSPPAGGFTDPTGSEAISQANATPTPSPRQPTPAPTGRPARANPRP